ncbi:MULTISPECIES: hypothetical protein [Streptomyces]|uniref:hypothetical protein n=1 Tax=Streptomyces TaxID=1883 RepID=UPI00278C3E22|nr:hypothetical protein [Streptomyces hydrogenans]
MPVQATAREELAADDSPHPDRHVVPTRAHRRTVLRSKQQPTTAQTPTMLDLCASARAINAPRGAADLCRSAYGPLPRPRTPAATGTYSCPAAGLPAREVYGAGASPPRV